MNVLAIFEDDYGNVIEPSSYVVDPHRIDRMVTTIHKLSKISGIDISELIEEGYLENGDLD